jgi:hypothetical protein
VVVFPCERLMGVTKEVARSGKGGGGKGEIEGEWKR